MKAPTIDDVELLAMAERIKPLVMRDGELWHIQPVDLRRIAYTWDPTVTHKAEGLVPFAEIKTLHKFSYHGFFKPSVAEVLACIRVADLNAKTMGDAIHGKAVAFHISSGPENADDLNREQEALNAGLHVATTTLYTKAA